MTARPAESARPVTPVAIAADLVRSAVARLDGADPDVLADLARAGRLLAGLDEYVGRCTTPASSALEALEERTRSEPWGSGLEQEMLSGHAEGAFLAMLVAITGARDVLEIGMFTGYSALAMAEAMPAGSRLVACEVDERAAAIAREALGAAPAGTLVDVRVAPALDTLRDLGAAGDRFDLVFVDADKAGYAGYLDALVDLGLLAPGAVVAVDNTLMQGEPWASATPTANGAAIAAFNARLAADPRWEQVLLPLRDGVTLARRAG
ncbi:class I SAM-dependent methyltransferase [Nocardioides sp. 1609]|uniref:O-methyltransferase n=1 Tax=Nocardioides sp. 1609 TaxID=2508327 RepID=UPI001070104A|nr:class I SAM-dependent methyltransferase [Nocardioides sp. 1609]